MRWMPWILALVLAACGGDDQRTGDGGSGPAPGSDGGPSTTPGDGGSAAGSDAGPTMSTGGGIGDPCSTDADCTEPPDAECFTTIENPLTGGVVEEFPNGFCSKGCEESSDCGSGENVACASSGMSGGGGGSRLQYCTIACDGPADCRSDEGYRCQTFFGFGFCAPP
jgi:hypothetical protein